MSHCDVFDGMWVKYDANLCMNLVLVLLLMIHLIVIKMEGLIMRIPN
ncbi:hypothetical protein RDI58_028937 [Solanum bulbocastanum]|uniref:Uncharacterized protein n=1 Tax=Solanum bulbocastanum TaxID=147425 RepID=A0AAN8SPK4_SOLBU